MLVGQIKKDQAFLYANHLWAGPTLKDFNQHATGRFHEVTKLDSEIDSRVRLFDGSFSMRKLQSGLGIHTLDATTLKDFERTSVREKGVVLHYVLEGHANASLAGEPMNMRRRKGQGVKMVLTALSQPEEFYRSSQQGEYVRKVNIFLSDAWISENDLQLPPVQSNQRHLRMEWELTSDETLLAERLATIGGSSSGLHRLEAESGALALTCAAFGKMADSDQDVSYLRPHELRRLQRMERYIEESTGPIPSLDEIAREGGVSPSTMRRVFRQAHGSTVSDFVRHTRLQRAKRALVHKGASISEAAQLAGYRSSENFSTAFRKYLGVTPSELSRGGQSCR